MSSIKYDSKHWYTLVPVDSAVLERWDRLLTKQIAEEPTARRYNNRGAVRVSLHVLDKHFDDALADFDNAVELAPDECAPRLNRGRLLEQLGRIADAIADYNVVVVAAAEEARYWAIRARALHKLGRFTDAVADYDVALWLGPHESIALERAKAAAGEPYPDPT